jgi:hypothetical protein
MRALATLVVMAATGASAAPLTLTALVDYNFIDQHGTGWASTAGKVTVTLALDKKVGTLKLKGHRGWTDGELGAPKTAGGPPEMNGRNWEGDVDETYVLHDVTRSGTTIKFKLDAIFDHLEGTCAPARVAKISRTTLYECSITGFGWQIIADEPEVHHPIVLDVRPGIVDTIFGAAEPKFGQRTVSEATPPATKHAP